MVQVNQLIIQHFVDIESIADLGQLDQINFFVQWIGGHLMSASTLFRFLIMNQLKSINLLHIKYGLEPWITVFLPLSVIYYLSYDLNNIRQYYLGGKRILTKTLSLLTDISISEGNSPGVTVAVDPHLPFL